MSEQSEDTTPHQVVVNEKEQYSLLPASRAVPEGWKLVGKQGTKGECLDYIHQVWSDMRPRALRESMDEAGGA
jgi:MbtH protein